MTRHVTFLVVHHTGRANSTVDSIRRYHTQGRAREGKQPFDDIGYHSVIYRNGEIHDGRPEERIGAHAANLARPGSRAAALTKGRTANHDSLGVVLVGNFQTDTPSAAQIEALVNRLQTWCWQHSIDPENIFGHRDFLTAKPCPGINLYRQLPTIRNRVAAHMQMTAVRETLRILPGHFLQ